MTRVWIVVLALMSGAPPESAAAIARALLLGRPMIAPDAGAGLPPDALKRLIEYREREAAFKSALTPPRGADDQERALFDRRVGVERVIFCLFPRRDTTKIAAGFAFDADFEHPAAFIDGVLRDLPVPWLGPYLNLVAGYDRLCAEGTGSAQLAAARDGGHPLIRAAAEYLLATRRCLAN